LAKTDEMLRLEAEDARDAAVAQLRVVRAERDALKAEVARQRDREQDVWKKDVAVGVLAGVLALIVLLNGTSRAWLLAFLGLGSWRQQAKRPPQRRGNKGNAAASVVVNNVDPVLFAQAMRALTELARIKGPAH